MRHHKFIKQWKRKQRRKQRALKRDLARLVHAGLVIEVKPGKYSLTDAGRAYVENMQS